MTPKQFYQAINAMTPEQREAMTVFANVCTFKGVCARDPQIDIIPTTYGALNMSLNQGPHESVIETYRELAGETRDEDDQAQGEVVAQEDQGEDQPIH